MNEKKVPEIRFKGFTDDWEQRKSGDIAPLRGGFAFKSNEYCSEGVPIVRISNILADGSVGADFAYYDEQENDEAYTLYDGAALLAMSGATTGKVSVLHAENGQKYYQNQRVGYFMPTDNCDYSFIRTIMKSQLFADQLSAVLVAGAQPNVSSKEIDGFEFMIPQSKEEQHKIGEYFKRLDNLITLHQRKHKKLLSVKKSMLEKMFPQNGAKVPEIRFEGFTDDWEQRKLGELGKARSGIGFPEAEQGGKEGVPFYKVSDMNNVGNEYEMVAANNHVTREQIARKGWKPIDEVPAIFFAKVGAAVLLNRKRLCRFPFLLDNNTMAYSIDESALDADFAITLFDTIDLTSLVQVGALPSYNSGDVENIDVVIPKMSEQRKIGAYFKRIDNLITLHQRELDKLVNIKKSMLKKMFV